MKPRYRLIFCAAACLSGNLAARAESAAAHWWLTTPDKAALVAEQAVLPFKENAPSLEPDIIVDSSKTYQSIDGFGFALTGGSAQNLIRMSPEKRHALLEEFFSRGADGIGVSYLRVSIGASDLNERVFSYDDLPAGQEDPDLEHFSLSEDLQNVVPILKEILAIAPSIKILGSPWSAPTWMKTNHNVQARTLRDECYPVYAKYFVRYVKEMAEQGIPIDAVTVQNEPFNDGNTPSMQLFAKQEARFIRDYLGPAFRDAGIRTKIVLYDHNCDAPQYPVSILTDPGANAYVDGSGFHLYEGSVTALSVVHDRFPTKNIYFTEQAVGGRNGFNIALPVSRVLIGATRNWSRNVILWNLGSDPEFRPHTDNGGCASCQGAVTIDGDKVERKLAYYVIAHASRFVPPGSVRIGSTSADPLPNVAFLTPEGQIVAVVANVGKRPRKFSIGTQSSSVELELPKVAVATLTWKP